MRVRQKKKGNEPDEVAVADQRDRLRTWQHKPVELELQI
jgi:hypothetical protein